MPLKPKPARPPYQPEAGCKRQRADEPGESSREDNFYKPVRGDYGTPLAGAVTLLRGRAGT